MVSQFFKEIKFLRRLPGGSDDGCRLWLDPLQLLSDTLKGLLPSDAASAVSLGSGQPIFVPDPFVIQAPGVAHPTGVDGVVLSWFVSVNLFLTRTDRDVTPCATACAETLGLSKKPNSHLESEIFRCQCAYRADIDGVEGVIIIERLPWKGRECVV